MASLLAPCRFALGLLFLAAPLVVRLKAAELENSNVAGPETAPVLAEHVPFTTRITVRNPHDRAAKVDRLDASCTCMQLAIGEKFLLPHATTTLDITVEDANRSGPQRMGVSVYFTDQELEPIEVQAWWKVVPDIAVDAIPPRGDPARRPEDLAWRDIYRFVASERPDEPNRLLKRIRLESPAESAPPGGLEILGIDYDGPVWRFAPLKQADGSWLVTATAKTPDQPLPERTYDETVTIRTNHPHKAAVKIQFTAAITRNAGRPNPDADLLPGM